MIYEESTTLESSMERLSASIDDIVEERARIRRILAEFYRAPLSMASVQPILDLAVELNPELKERK
jgi:hypothetical protein